MKTRLLTSILLFFICGIALAQEVPQTSLRKQQIDQLTDQILRRMPDRRYTAQALGRGDDRTPRARAHATAIVDAARAYLPAWQAIAASGAWKQFDPVYDLPPLIAAMSYREASFRSIARLDNGDVVTAIPTTGRGRKLTLLRSDIGVMQVRAPSRPARRCGATTDKDVKRLLTDLAFAYNVGTCILTRRIENYATTYQSRKFHRLRRGERSQVELRFYGVQGPRKGSIDAQRARDLISLERYNWGGKDYYQGSTNSGYARRVLTEFEFFRQGVDALKPTPAS